MMSFFGNLETVLDEKGGMILPAAFREVLQGGGAEVRLVIRRDFFQNCLVLLPESVWHEQLKLLRLRLDRWNALHQMLLRQFASTDVEVMTLDSDGRLLIPKRFQRTVGIRKSIRLIGMDETIEIWSREATAVPFMKTAQFRTEIERILGAKEREE